MTKEEAIKRIQDHMPVHGIGKYPHNFIYEALNMAINALREQEERDHVWQDAKNSPPKKPGVQYGKVDDTNSMYACQYRDGVWTMNAYPGTLMCITEWAYYDAFLREDEQQKWIPVTERVPKQTDPAEKVLFVTESGGLFIGCYYKGVSTRQFDGWYSMCTRIDKVTHWMPLPEPPKE